MGKGPRDFMLVTPEEYYEIQQGSETTRGTHTLEKLRRMAKDKRRCIACGAPAWKLAGVGLCFPCTTGESDASQDYELREA